MPGWADKWKDRGRELLPQHLCICEWKQQILEVANPNTGGSSGSSCLLQLSSSRTPCQIPVTY